MTNASPSPRQLIGLGSGLVGFIVLGLVAGLLLDTWLDTSPLFIVIGLGLGIVGAAVSLVVSFRKYMRN